MVSNASDDFPDPDSPVKTIRRSRGSSIETFLRLCSRAPRTTSVSAIRTIVARFGQLRTDVRYGPRSCVAADHEPVPEEVEILVLSNRYPGYAGCSEIRSSGSSSESITSIRSAPISPATRDDRFHLRVVRRASVMPAVNQRRSPYQLPISVARTASRSPRRRPREWRGRRSRSGDAMRTAHVPHDPQPRSSPRRVPPARRSTGSGRYGEPGRPRARQEAQWGGGQYRPPHWGL